MNFNEQIMQITGQRCAATVTWHPQPGGTQRVTAAGDTVEKARGAEKGLSSNPQNPQKHISTAFEPFEGDLGGRFSRNSPSEPEPTAEFCNALKEPVAPMDNRPAASGGNANELIAG